MDATAFVFISLLVVCGFGLGVTEFDADISDRLKQDPRITQSDENDNNRLLGDLKRDWSYSYPDLKFSQLGIGKRTLDYLRFHTTVGKRLDLLTMIRSTLDKSRDLNTGSYLPLDEEMRGRFGSRLSPVRRSLRNRKDSQRMPEDGPRVVRGRRQEVDPILYLIGIGK